MSVISLTKANRWWSLKGSKWTLNGHVSSPYSLWPFCRTCDDHAPTMHCSRCSACRTRSSQKIRHFPRCPLSPAVQKCEVQIGCSLIMMPGLTKVKEWEWKEWLEGAEQWWKENKKHPNLNVMILLNCQMNWMFSSPDLSNVTNSKIRGDSGNMQSFPN